MDNKNPLEGFTMPQNLIDAMKSVDVTAMSRNIMPVDPFIKQDKVFKEALERTQREKEKKEQEEKQYREFMEEKITQISEHTASLIEIVATLREIKLTQEQANVLMEGIMEIVKAESREEAETIATKIIGRIQSVGATLQAITAVTKILTSICTALAVVAC